MKLFNTDMSFRTGLVIVAAITLSAAFLLFSSTSENSVSASSKVAGTSGSMIADFPGTNLGGIPDSAGCQPTQGTPRNVTFEVAGLTGAPSNVEVSTTFGGPNHTWAGDVTATLIAPNGLSHSIFGRVIATTSGSAGDSSDLGGTYAFADNHAAPPSGGFWQAATVALSTDPIAVGDYRTTPTGGAGAVNPAPATNMNAAFAGVANPNGTWTLRLTDGCGGDTGAISAANLTVEGVTGPPADANADFDGDGKTDYTVARGTLTPLAEGNDLTATSVNRRNVSGLEERPAKVERSETAELDPQAPPIYWYTRFSGNGSTLISQHGDAATDFITPEDFDGDGKDDLTVWTEGAATVANFKIFQSSTNTLRVETFGQTGDDPAIVGDYDGDGKADPAVFRCPGFGSPAGQCFYFYRGSLNNPGGNVTYVPWGFGNVFDFFPLIGDFDGDGKYDFNLQRANPSVPSQGQFVLLKSAGFGVEYVNWGSSSDFLIPGDYDGDGKHDFMVRRTVSGTRQHFLLTRTGATSQQQWGIAGDSSAPGDYDGDGKTDLAIWRSSTDPNNNYFWVLNSGNGSVSLFEWGQCATVSTCDFAVAGWAVH